MKKSTYSKKQDKKQKEIEKLENEKLELTNVYKYEGKEKTKAKKRNKARIVKYEASRLKLKYKKGNVFQKFLIIFMMFLILFMIIGIVFTLYIIINAPKFETSTLYSKEASVLLDKNGIEFARLGTENRETVTYDDLPQVLIDAIVATEDSRFFQHNGVDLARFSKAVIGQLLGQRDAGGGSTLTMQVVKNTYTSTESSGIQGIIRKFTDIYMAVFKVEKSYTKEQIIEFYVNQAYLGSGTYGVEQACQTYFGKSVEEISLSEAALIAGLFQAPGAYDPSTYPEKAEERRNIVLSLMKRHGYITDTEYNLAKKISVESLIVDGSETLNKYQGFVDTVVMEVIKRTGNNPATTSMTIYTTLDTKIQDVIEKVYSEYNWVNDVVQTGIAVVDVKDGSISAVGAGRNKKTQRSLNYATSISRQPGSTAKPIFDYGPAIEYLDWSTGQTVIDDEFTYSGGGKIKNWDNLYKGIMTAADALASSRNIPALYAFQQVSQSNIKEFVTNLGIKPEYESGYINESHSIGGFTGVSPLELSAAYATFSRGGTYIEPYSFTKLEYTNSGETYTVKPVKRKAMSESTAYMINMMLRHAVTGGFVSTGTVSGTDVASKTGTSTVDSARLKKLGLLNKSVIGDSWQISYSPDYSIAMWYGYNETTEKYYLKNAEGNKAKKEIIRELGKNIFKKNSRWTKPTSVVSAEIELETDPLMLASENTPEDLRATFLFKKGTAPKEVSSRFAKLNNPTNVKYSIDNNQTTITWDAIATPQSLDTNYIRDYFSNNIYQRWVETYLPKRIEYNTLVLGDLGYSVYINDKHVATTTQPYYTYNGVLASNSTITIKSTYLKYANCESDGVTIVVTVPGITSPSTTPTTSPFNSFEIVLNGDSTISKADYLSKKATLVKVVSNNVDVTSMSTIKYSLSDEELILPKNEVTISVTYNNVTKTKVITVIN